MLGFVYIILSSYIGYNLIENILPSLFKVSKVKRTPTKTPKLNKKMVVLPAAFLIGTLIMTWFTYLVSYAFYKYENPMLYGNIISFAVSILITAYFIRKKRNKYRQVIKRIRSLRYKDIIKILKKNRIEIIFITICTLVWTYFMFRSFYIKNGTIFIGISVFSDFAPHLAMIRSFSFGANFPTEYAHFPDGTIRYHFMFQFLAGNLEYLGMRLDYAFNLPSILSIVSFMILLYSFVIIITKKQWIAIITSVLFFFRSSFAFFTYIEDKGKIKDIISNIMNNSLHIGKTLHEEWGLYAQKVYLNQRHLAFALGILMLILITIYPLFKMMIIRFKKVKARTKINLEKNYSIIVDEKGKNESKDNNKLNIIYKSIIYFNNYIKEFLFTKDAWMPRKIKRAIVLGIVLGLLSFWNGAVVIATLSILLIIAIFSKRRLEFLIIAIITVILTYLQTLFFVGAGTPVISPEWKIGFLSSSSDIIGILKFYFELLGILPILLLIGVLMGFKKWRLIISLILSISVVYIFIKLFPDFNNTYKYIIGVIILLSIFIITFYNTKTVPKGFLRLSLIFLAPIILATTLKLTPDITVNHKYIMISSILLNIILASFLYRLFSLRKIMAILLAIMLTITITITGIVDIITLYNLDKGAIQIKIDDPLLVWAANNTGEDEIFLTHIYSLHPLLLSGRKIFSGWPYYAWSAGYDIDARGRIIKQIYEGNDKDTILKLLKENNIVYIVVEDDNRKSKDYKLNEKFIEDNFDLVYKSNQGRYLIYKTN